MSNPSPEIHGVLRNAYFLFEGDVRCPCLKGDVYEDAKGRFRDGDHITTSTLFEQLSEDTFRTRFSVYRVESWRVPLAARTRSTEQEG
jgi:hypothetical protein